MFVIDNNYSDARGAAVRVSFFFFCSGINCSNGLLHEPKAELSHISFAVRILKQLDLDGDDLLAGAQFDRFLSKSPILFSNLISDSRSFEIVKRESIAGVTTGALHEGHDLAHRLVYIHCTL